MSIHRILALYRTASMEERERGFFWYDTARDELDILARQYSLPMGLVAGVVAVLSPRVSWPTNLLDAESLLDDWSRGQPIRTITALGSNVTKAENMLTCHCVWPHLSGPKVTSFYANLCGDYGPVTLDTHAVHAHMGVKWPVNWLAYPRLKSIADDYRRAADSVGIEPARFQATVWVVHKRRLKEGKL